MNKKHVTIVTIDGGNEAKESVHIFSSDQEAVNFVNWMQSYNADLDIKVESVSQDNVCAK
jgi:hypothetical protein